MKKFLLTILFLSGFVSLSAYAQADKRDIRAGNRQFRKEEYRKADVEYRKALVKDSLSFAGSYNLASNQYRQEDYQGAARTLETLSRHPEAVPAQHSADYFYNLGDVALQAQNYQAAVQAFRNSLLLRPDDLDAKENYIYAKKKLEDQQNQGGGGGDNDQNRDDNQDQDQDQNQNDDQNNNQDQNQDQPQDQDQNQNESPQPQDQKISPQQAQQMLNAIQAKEKETQDKVNKEKAALLQSRQKEKNW